MLSATAFFSSHAFRAQALPCLWFFRRYAKSAVQKRTTMAASLFRTECGALLQRFAQGFQPALNFHDNATKPAVSALPLQSYGRSPLASAAMALRFAIAVVRLCRLHKSGEIPTARAHPHTFSIFSSHQAAKKLAKSIKG